MSKTLPRLVILDRDGVINYDSPDYIKSADEWIPIASSIEAIRVLNERDIKVAVASNQRGIGRGLFTEGTLMDMTNKMHSSCKAQGAKIDAVHYCPALSRDHPDHKPNPGMLLAILKEFSISAMNETVYFVGDKISDVQAAINAHCVPVLITQDGELIRQAHVIQRDILVFSELLAFVNHLLREA